MTRSNKRLVVLSNKSQCDCFLREGHDPKDFCVLCDNEPFYPFLDAQGISYEKIDEFLLRNMWKEINHWGWSKAAGLIRRMQTHGYFKKIDLPSVIFLWLSVYLILLLKNYFYATHILETYQPSEIFIFSPKDGYIWRDYSGSAFLNHFLEEAATSRQIRSCVLKAEWEPETFRPPQAGLKKVLRTILKKATQNLYGLLVRPPKKIDVLTWGTLRHLAPPMVEFKKARTGVVFYDEEFRLEHFQFSQKNKIPYLIPECFPDSKKYYDEGLAERLSNEISRAFAEPFMNDYFLFGTHDFGPFVRMNFLGKMDGLCKQIAREAAEYEMLLGATQLSSLLLHEDFNARAFLAAFMKTKNVPVFCISHANWVIDCAIAKEDRSFAHAHTFVLSQHEKDAYCERGWDGEKIFTTGIPRYDRLIKMTRERQRLSGPIKILFCAAFFLPFNADTVGFIGLNIFAFRRHQERAVRMLAKAAQGLPVTIVIKPQFGDDESLWVQFVAKELPDRKIEVVSAERDYFELLKESDAMALCMWSSTIVEAGLANVPTYFLNLDQQNSEQVSRYRSSGLCEVFENNAQLRMAFEKLCSSDRVRNSQRPLSPQQEYYLGNLDGNANSRVVEFILEKIGKR